MFAGTTLSIASSGEEAQQQKSLSAEKLLNIFIQINSMRYICSYKVSIKQTNIY